MLKDFLSALYGSANFIEEIYLRFQLTKNGISMSGFDVSRMMEQLEKVVKK